MKTLKNLCVCTAMFLFINTGFANAKSHSLKAAGTTTDSQKDFTITFKQKSLTTADTIYVTFYIHYLGTTGTRYDYEVYIVMSSPVPAGSSYYLQLTLNDGTGNYIQPSWTVYGGYGQSTAQEISIYQPFTKSLITNLYESPSEFNGNYISVNTDYQTY